MLSRMTRLNNGSIASHMNMLTMNSSKKSHAFCLRSFHIWCSSLVIMVWVGILWLFVIMIEEFKTYRINFLVDRFIASLIGSLMRIKLLGRRRQWFLDECEDCLSVWLHTLNVGNRASSATPKNHQLRMPLRKRPCAELFDTFCRHKKYV